MVRRARWECGSAYPLVMPAGRGWTGRPDQVRLYGSGRQALTALLDFGRRRLGWSTVHLPRYYCQRVVAAVPAGLPVVRYDAGPAGGAGAPSGGRARAVVAVSYFGAVPRLPWPPGPADRAGPAGGRPALIVDATHDPFAPWLADPELAGVPVDYVFGSLRKTLPVPDGGALWSPAGHPLPRQPAPTPAHLAGVSHTLSAMCLKHAYLAGAPVSKDGYLELFAAADQAIDAGGVSGVSEYTRQALDWLAVDRLRQRRLGNATLLAERLCGLPGAQVLRYPLGVVLLFDSGEHRDAVRAGLLERRVYPAVLWRLPPDAGPSHLEYSRRMLFLHCDLRFSTGDLRRVGRLVRQVTATAGAGSRRPPGGLPC